MKNPMSALPDRKFRCWIKKGVDDGCVRADVSEPTDGTYERHSFGL
jgi:hypothetical protein